MLLTWLQYLAWLASIHVVRDVRVDGRPVYYLSCPTLGGLCAAVTVMQTGQDVAAEGGRDDNTGAVLIKVVLAVEVAPQFPVWVHRVG